MHRRRFLQNVAGSVAVLSTCTSLVAGNHSSLQAGVARVDFTPPMSMKASLGGYGARMSKPAEGVHDRVWVKCVVLNDGTRRLAIVTADSLCFPPPIRQAVMTRLKEQKIQVDEVLILPSHSHNSFDLFALHPKNIFRIPQIGIYQKEAFEHVITKLVEVIAKANQNFQPVKIGTHSLDLPGWSRNRRGVGVTDPTLTVTRIDLMDGKPLAALVFWAAHPTFLTPKEMLFSGDWPGQLQRSLESLIGQDVTVLYANGAQGDQSPTPRPHSGESPWEKSEDYGRDLGIVAHRVWQKTSPQDQTSLSWQRSTFTLPKRSKHKDFLKIGGAEYGILEKSLDIMLMSLFPTETQTLSVRLGDLQIVGVPGELAAELGLEVKKQVTASTGARHVVIGGLADEWVSYMLSAREYQRGGYEATISFYGETLGQTVVDAVVKNAAMK